MTRVQVRCTNVDCSAPVAPHMRFCAACEYDVGFPNVRMADSSAEVSALNDRLNVARSEVARLGTQTIFDDFMRQLTLSAAVYSCSFPKCVEIIASDNRLIGTFYREFNAGIRVPEDNIWDQVRGSIDALLFPNYIEQIRFAALALNDKGISGYGDCYIKLRDSAISRRATVFHENSAVFVRERKLGPSTGVPPGFRASWQRRAELAASKLYPKISASTAAKDFPDLLISGDGTTADFVEVHIYGSLNRHSIANVALNKKIRKADKALARAISESAKKANIPYSEL